MDVSRTERSSMKGMIYLLRHGRPQLPGDGRLCIGRGSDLHLSETGIKEAEKLRDCFPDLRRVYTSPLARTVETAQILADGKAEIVTLPDLTEIDVGEWEGMSFADIRRLYPAIYKERGRDWSIPPVGGESLASAADRMQKAVMELSRNSGEDVVAVTSDGVIRALLWRLLHLDTRHDTMIQQPYGSLTAIRFENGALTVTSSGRLPEDVPPDEEIEELWDLCAVSQTMRDHAVAVCDFCLELRERLLEKGIILSYGRLRTGALLYNVRQRRRTVHTFFSSNLLRERGYLPIACLIDRCAAGSFGEEIDESLVLYLADKMTFETERVKLDDNTDRSQFKQALEIKNKIEGIIGEI